MTVGAWFSPYCISGFRFRPAVWICASAMPAPVSASITARWRVLFSSIAALAVSAWVVTPSWTVAMSGAMRAWPSPVTVRRDGPAGPQAMGAASAGAAINADRAADRASLRAAVGESLGRIGTSFSGCGVAAPVMPRSGRAS